jgi:hypothetical protein
MKILLIVTTTFLLAGCTKNEDSITLHHYEKICVEGHVYFHGYNRLAIKLDDEGKPIKCSMERR